jgi:flagellar basal-body rod protein FlgB
LLKKPVIIGCPQIIRAGAAVTSSNKSIRLHPFSSSGTAVAKRQAGEMNCPGDISECCPGRIYRNQCMSISRQETLQGIDRIAGLLSRFLDVQSRRTQMIAGNLANADTPGYQALDLDFDAYLERAAQSALMPGAESFSTTTHLNNPDGPEVISQTDNLPGIDGNTVDVGREMASLADAGMRYLQGASLLQSRLRTLRTAIREGR